MVRYVMPRRIQPMATAAPTTEQTRPSPAARQEDLRLAAIDVGSNSIHMIVANVAPSGAVTTLWRLKDMIGLGRNSFPSHQISPQSMSDALRTLRRFRQAARSLGCEQILAVATSAVREAENGQEFVDRIRQRLGLTIRIVSARDEARLIYLGVRHAVDLEGGPHAIIDVGGGSVEFVVAEGRRPLLLESLQLGAARMTAQFVHSDPISSGELKELIRHYRQQLAPVCRKMRSFKPERIIGTSGTLENLAAMCGTGEKWDDRGFQGHLEKRQFMRLLDQLMESSESDRAKLPGLDRQRRDQIVAGAGLVGELMRQLEIDRIDLCRAALREGIVWDHLARHRPDVLSDRRVPDPRRRSVIHLARRCDWHEPHSQQVTKLCLKLFDELRAMHHLGDSERELIEFGSMLHDIGWHIGRAKHHKHSAYLILHGELKGFSPQDIMVIANIARYHRKAAPDLSHTEYASLSPAQRRVVQVGAAILRIADGLDRTHCNAISDLRCRAGGRKVSIILESRGDTRMEIQAARRKMQLFQDVFGREVRFRTNERRGG